MQHNASLYWKGPFPHRLPPHKCFFFFFFLVTHDLNYCITFITLNTIPWLWNNALPLVCNLVQTSFRIGSPLGLWLHIILSYKLTIKLCNFFFDFKNDNTMTQNAYTSQHHRFCLLFWRGDACENMQLQKILVVF